MDSQRRDQRPVRRTPRLRVLAASQENVHPALRVLLVLTVLLTLLATGLTGQEAISRLSLEEALRLASQNNPGFQRQRNDQAAADWGVREAYGSFLPSASVSSSLSYTEAGVQRIGTLDFGAQSTDWFTSSYGLNFSWSISGNTLFGVSSARANQSATAARISAAEFDLQSAVTLQYMAALRANDAVAVAERQWERTQQNYEIVSTRVETGAAAGTEGKQASVDLGRAEVTLIQAQQSLDAQKLLLMERIGVPLEEGVELVNEFTVFAPEWERNELIAMAMDRHPSLTAFVAQERASKAGVRQARSSYFPTISFFTGFRGNTRQALNDDFLINQAESGAIAAMQSCQRWQLIQGAVGQPLPGIDVSGDCGDGVLSSQVRDAIIEDNDVFPFNFTKTPLNFSLQVSMPVFQGFTRQRQVEQAQAAELDAVQNRRQEELRLRTSVTQAYNAMMAAYQVVGIEERNRALAEERLDLARLRYQIGAGPAAGGQFAGSTFLELLDAQSSMTVAERDHLTAVYDFHLALAQLEAATGQSLRPGEGPNASPASGS